MAEYTIVSSEVDRASVIIRDSLIDGFGFRPSEKEYDGSTVFRLGDIEIVTSRRDLLFVDDLDEHFAPRAYVFISRHKSQSGLPTLTAHFTGNIDHKASHGGNPRELGWTYPSLLRDYMIRLSSLRGNLPGYDIVLEGTHHGPTSLARPCLFVEIGSTEREWNDSNAAKAVGQAMIGSLSHEPRSDRIGLGIGGPHYSKKFTDIMLNEGVAFAGFAPKHALGSLNQGILGQFVLKSLERVGYAIIDWKGLGGEKDRIVELMMGSDLEVLRV